MQRMKWGRTSRWRIRNFFQRGRLSAEKRRGRHTNTLRRRIALEERPSSSFMNHISNIHSQNPRNQKTKGKKHHRPASCSLSLTSTGANVSPIVFFTRPCFAAVAAAADCGSSSTRSYLCTSLTSKYPASVNAYC